MSQDEVRALRDCVFETPSSDKNWDYCKDKWSTPENIRWLEEEARKLSEKCQSQITSF